MLSAARVGTRDGYRTFDPQSFDPHVRRYGMVDASCRHRVWGVHRDMARIAQPFGFYKRGSNVESDNRTNLNLYEEITISPRPSIASFRAMQTLHSAALVAHDGTVPWNAVLRAGHDHQQGCFRYAPSSPPTHTTHPLLPHLAPHRSVHRRSRSPYQQAYHTL